MRDAMSPRQAHEPLVIDLSPAPAPEEAAVRAWATSQTVFVSSVMVGMSAERRAAAEAIAAVGAVPVLFEDFGGMDDDPEDAYLGNVAASDIYVGLLGARYGKPLRTGYSATHAEYNEAVQRGLRVSVWRTDGDLDGPQRDFLETVRVFRTTGSYASPEDLAIRIERRLRTMAAESLSPWVKVGNTVFRATSILDNGNTVTVRARVRDRSVAASIEALRPSQSLGRNTDTRLTWPAGTCPVRISRVEIEVGPGMARSITLTGDRLPDGQPNMLDMAVDGRTPEDLTELAMRVALFDEPNPLGVMKFLIEGENPLPALDGLSLSEDAVAQVAELLLAEALVGKRGVDHLTTFQLGPQHGGRRRLVLGWMPRQRFNNQRPIERRIDGHITVRRQ